MATASSPWPSDALSISRCAVIQTVEAVVDCQGRVRLLGPIHVKGTQRALVTVLDEMAVPVQPIGEGDLDDRHFISRPKRMTAQEVVAWLAEMAAMNTGDSLPANWSRADIYDEDEPR